MRYRAVAGGLLLLAAFGSYGCGGQAFTANGGGDDASPSDASTTPESDAPGGTSWCADHASDSTFCADFDESPDIATAARAWTLGPISTGPTATMSLVQGPGTPSPPNALSAAAVGTKLLAEGDAVVLYVTFARHALYIHVEFELRVDQVAITGAYDSVTIMGVLYGKSISDAKVFLSFTKQGLLLGVGEADDAGALPSYTTVAPTPPQGQWAGRFGVDMTLGTTGSVQVSHDNVPVGAPQPLPAALQSADLVTLAVGVVPIGQTGPVGVSFDNVRFDLRSQ